MSLPSPLTASDEYVRQKDSGIEIIRVTAGLHRQVWVSGTSIFVDVHIANNSRRTIKKLELQLERDILCYKHVRQDTKRFKLSAECVCFRRQQQPQWNSRPVKPVSSIKTSGRYLASRP